MDWGNVKECLHHFPEISEYHVEMTSLSSRDASDPFTVYDVQITMKKVPSSIGNAIH
jgi:hypothetical protein